MSRKQKKTKTKHSIVFARAVLARMEKQLDGLLVERKELVRQLQGVDQEIAVLEGGKPVSGSRAAPKKKTGLARGRKAAKKTKVHKNAAPLAVFVLKALEGAKEGMRVKDIVAKVRDAGYKTGSTPENFYISVASILSKDKRFKKSGRGVYGLAN